MLERQLINYLNINQLFPDRQSAYRAFHSTETALADVLSGILLAIDSGNLSLLDLSAAFDTVDHDILLQRLHLSFGMSSTALEWMTSYLTGRQQCVRHAGSSSTATTLTCGVPQGSVLGPILFLLYTADILSIISKHSLHGHLYADDSQVYGFCRPDSTEVQHLRSVSVSCISDIADWMICNRLQLNSSKSQFIWCSSSRRVERLDRSPFVIGADAVEPRNEVRDLGLILDSDLSMTTHITGLVRTSFGILRQLRSVSRSLTQDATRHLVQSLILSRIDYCNVAFAGSPQRSIIRLQAVINAAARLVLRLKKFDHISTAIQDELQWLRVGERIKFKLCILVHKCMNNCAPGYLADKIRPLSDDVNRSQLRSSKSADVFVPATKTKAGDRAFRVAGPRAWNSLPAPIPETKSLSIFKKQLKMHLLLNHEH